MSTYRTTAITKNERTGILIVQNSAGFERLQLQRLISATPERVFEAWTNPKELTKWWGPTGVICQSAEVNLQVGGQYRIANELPDGRVLWISGEFEQIERPSLLIYTWVVESENAAIEKVKVLFEPHERGTSLTITHEQIATKALSDQHEQGWIGCMDGLVNHIAPK